MADQNISATPTPAIKPPLVQAEQDPAPQPAGPAATGGEPMPDTATENMNTATEKPDTAVASPDAQAQAGTTASPDSETTGQAAGALDAAAEPSGTGATTPAPQEPGQLERKPPPRRNPRQRLNPKKPPLEIEKNPYLE